MDVREFDPARDTHEAISKLNPFPGEWQTWMASSYVLPESRNIIVAEDQGELVGVLHIFDCGFPWVNIDGWYLKPEYRSMENARKMGQYAEQQLKARGVVMVAFAAPSALAHILSRYGYVAAENTFVYLQKALI